MTPEPAPKVLPHAEISELTLGYMRLTDSAPLILAEELGMYEKYGLKVHLQREVSWANIRDKLIAGTFDACQMLATMPLVTSLGATGIRAPMVTGLVLSLNGNGITLAPTLWERMQQVSETELPSTDARVSARAFKNILRERLQQPFSLATVHNFSTHTILLRLWLQSAGIDPERDVRIIVLPPEQMVDSLAQGVIDGFCVGEPWNSIAVEYGVGTLAATGFQVWNNAPEKVLGVMQEWHTRHPATHLRLRLALMESCRWLADMKNRDQTVKILARSQYLDLPEDYLRPSLIGCIPRDRNGDTHQQAEFHVFSRYNAGFPWRSHAELLLRQCAAMLGKELDNNKLASLTQQCFRTDLYREAARKLGIPAPDKDTKTEGVHAQPWEYAPDIELGSDLILSPATELDSTAKN